MTLRAAPTLLLASVLLMLCLPAHAAPTGSALATTCERALASGFRDRDAGFCEWYVVPCPVCGAEPQPPPICPPPDTSSVEFARVVTAALRRHPEAATRAAPDLVREILLEAYPCR